MKLITSLLLILLLALTSLPLAAQIDTPCSALVAEDCTILVTALERFNALGSFNNAAFSVELSGGGGTSTGNAASVAGSGPMWIDESGTVTGFAFSLGDAELLWLGDMLYLGRVGEDGEIGWQGASLEDENAQFLVNLLSGNLLGNAFNQPGVAVTQRLADTEQNGQVMQVFQSDIDLITLLLTPDILEVLENLLAALSPEDTGADLGSFGGDIAGAIPLLGLLLQKDQVQTSLWIGAEDGLIHHVELLIDIVLDPSMLDPNQESISFFLKVVSELDGHGTEFAIAEPAEFEAFDLRQFDLGALMGNMMGGGAGEAPPQLTDDERYAVEFSIGMGETVTGVLSASNTQDVWGLTAKKGDVLSIILKAADPESILDTRLYLRGLAGEEIWVNDDHDTQREGLNLFDSVIENYTIPADGEYRLVATWLAPVSDGAYELTVEVAN